MKPTQQKQFDKASFQESVKKHLSATYATTVELLLSANGI